MDSGLAKRAQRIESTILHSIARIGQGRIAEMIGKAPSTITVFKDEHLRRMSEVLAACGLKAVNDTDESIDLEEIRAIRVLAKKHLESRIDVVESGLGGS